MRIDKFLQVSRIIKRRAVSKEIVEKGRVVINDKTAKPSSQVNIDDIVSIKFGDVILTIKILIIDNKIKKSQSSELYEIIKKEESE